MSGDFIRPGSKECICEWPDHCAGTGILDCEGCGGDQCVCRCGGTMEGPGCDDCDEDWVD